MSWVRSLALALVPAVGATLILTASPASAAGVPHIRGTSTVPAYSYDEAVRESVWVQTGLDSDRDGAGDRIAVDVVRPRAATRIPVIMEGSPYYACCGRGNEGELKVAAGGQPAPGGRHRTGGDHRTGDRRGPGAGGEEAAALTRSVSQGCAR